MSKPVLLLIALGSMIFSSASMAGSLEALIDNTSRELIAEIRQGRDSFDQNPCVLYDKVDAILANLVDYPLISRGVMGAYYKGATPAQRAAFESTFRKSIIKLLTKSLIVIESKSIRVLPLEEEPDTRATVAMEVSSTEGNSYRLVYSMAKEGEVWRVRNIIVDGINLGLIYRNQFKSAMNEERNDIETVIHDWRPQAQNK